VKNRREINVACHPFIDSQYEKSSDGSRRRRRQQREFKATQQSV